MHRLHVVLFLIPVVLLLSFGGCTSEHSTLLPTQLSTTESITVPESTSQAAFATWWTARNETNARKAPGAEETTPSTYLSTDGTMATTPAASSTSAESTEHQASSLSPRISKTTKSTHLGKGVSEEQLAVFEYDDYYLRRLGLIFAAVLFVMGILVLICDKRCPMPKCHTKKAK
ncbi:FXYD domain containing ion transport regulator 5 [Polyodon spathula]|uniref:FXYD domain containing ion transport regulator 5 n=1 Tax=Polyodon spathula TaxID=7913 RepID=UPI001B7D9935|nr:FXYD domain containing ion transport regulator 5 [Polyodon spathula]